MHAQAVMAQTPGRRPRHDPVGEQFLDPLLRNGEAVVVAGREVADVQRHPGEAGDLGLPSGRQKAVDQAPLIQDLQRAGVKASGPAAQERLAAAALDERGIHARQRQFACQHQTGRTGADDQKSPR